MYIHIHFICWNINVEQYIFSDATILSSPSKKEAAIYLWAWQTSALFGRARACGYRHNAADDNDDEDEHRNHQHPCHLEPMVGATNLAPNAPQLAAQ